MPVLVTGGTGYIGSHACVELLNAGYQVVIFDNFSNSRPAVQQRIERIAGKPVTLLEGDIRSRSSLTTAIEKYGCKAVMHFAGLKAVGESVKDPLSYYDVNVCGTVSLIEAMRDTGLKTLVFSSSATVYGEPTRLPIEETHRLSATNPYGRTKLIIEEILRDLYAAEDDWHIGILRYFNPVGAHESGLIGEDPQGLPNNLMPYVAQVAIGRRDALSIWGSDYPTHDGTGVRDYIHVVDLAIGHIKALEKLEKSQCLIVNLGTGMGHSVLEVVRAFEQASGKTVPYRISARRPGDVAACYADPTLAHNILGWKAERNLESMCRDHWNFQHLNPDGIV